MPLAPGDTWAGQNLRLAAPPPYQHGSEALPRRAHPPPSTGAGRRGRAVIQLGPADQGGTTRALGARKVPRLEGRRPVYDVITLTPASCSSPACSVENAEPNMATRSARFTLVFPLARVREATFWARTVSGCFGRPLPQSPLTERPACALHRRCLALWQLFPGQ